MGNDRAEPGEQGTPEGSTLEEVHLAQFEYFDLLVERRLRDLRHMRRKISRTKGFACYVFGMCNGMGSRKSARRASSALTLEWSRRGAAIAVEAAIHDRGPAGERVEVSRVGVGGARRGWVIWLLISCPVLEGARECTTKPWMQQARAPHS